MNLCFDIKEQYFVCQNSFRNILGIFKYQWKTLKTAALTTIPGSISHGNLGKQNRRKGCIGQDVEDDVVEFLTQLGEKRGEAYATRFVRKRTELGIRNDEEGVVELPSCYSKRSLFEQFCYERGYVVKPSAKGNYGEVDNFEPRPFDEDLWPEGSTTLEVLTWSKFHQIWKQKLPKLRIRSKCEDTCPECWVLKNQFWYKSSRNRQRCSSDSDGSVFSDQSAEYSDEDLIIKANEHVTQAAAQRTYINELKEKAHQEALNEHEARR